MKLITLTNNDRKSKTVCKKIRLAFIYIFSQFKEISKVTDVAGCDEVSIMLHSEDI